ncbi:MAG: helix-turn-helix domain-containing protein, partial [Clostridia bacterium]|nr:helix-turn-helix domain-containing protein [Clostridia bacterium]
DRLTALTDEMEGVKSQKHLALGMDYRSLSNALNYGILPSTRTLIKIADYFNVSVDYLAGNTNEAQYTKAEVPSNFNQRFQALCVEYGVTDYRISTDCHFSKNYPARWRKNNLIPTYEIVQDIADYFKVSLDYLLGRTDKRK